MGFKKERFETPPPNELICIICKGVFEDPVQGTCGHVYCSNCRIKSDPWNYEDICPVEHNYNPLILGLGRGKGMGHGRSFHSSSYIVGHVSVRGGFGGPLGLDDAPLPGYEQLQFQASQSPPRPGASDRGQSKPEQSCPSGTVQLAEPLRALLNKQRIKCKYYDVCHWSGPIQDMAVHQSVCAKQVIHREIDKKYQEIRDLKKKLLDLTSGDN